VHYYIPQPDNTLPGNVGVRRSELRCQVMGKLADLEQAHADRIKIIFVRNKYGVIITEAFPRIKDIGYVLNNVR
jgi:hypothetical protein